MIFAISIFLKSSACCTLRSYSSSTPALSVLALASASSTLRSHSVSILSFYSLAWFSISSWRFVLWGSRARSADETVVDMVKSTSKSCDLKNVLTRSIFNVASMQFTWMLNAVKFAGSTSKLYRKCVPKRIDDVDLVPNADFQTEYRLLWCFFDCLMVRVLSKNN
jgi:hypothetical protein